MKLNLSCLLPSSNIHPCFLWGFSLRKLRRCLCVGFGKIPASLSSRRAGEQSSAGAFLHKQRASHEVAKEESTKGGNNGVTSPPPLVIHQSVYQTMMAILAGARLLAAQICPNESFSEEGSRIHCEEAGVLERYYGSGLACSYSPPIKRAVLRRPLYNPKL